VPYLLVAAAALAAGVLVGRATAEREPRIVIGTVEGVDAQGIGISVRREGYVVGNGLMWQGVDGSWREGGQPDCLPPMSSGARVELGLLPATNEVTGQVNQVLWVRCLSGPTARS
jgi:hypothetical protein